MGASEFFLYKSNNKYDLDYVITIIKKTYEKMCDDESKTIYYNRAMYSLFHDNYYLRKVILETVAGKELNDFLECNKGNVFIYAAGRRGERLLETFPNAEFNGFVDAFKIGDCGGKKIFTIDEFITEYEKRKCSIIVSCLKNQDEIVKSLLSRGVKKEKIYRLDEWNYLAAENIYYDNRCITKDMKIDSMIDCGTYDGQNIVDFLLRFEGEGKKVYAFEPDRINYEKCVNKFKEYKNVEIYNYGLSEKNEKMYISNALDGIQSNIVLYKDENNEEISLVSLDEICGDKKIDMIKMDIEGFELQALKGAKKILKEQLPVLAISIYHKREDIWELPNFIMSISDKYRFYMGHYSIGMTDTVLYAIPK